jgi:hypothetical protein
MNPNFRTPHTLLEPLAKKGYLGKEPNEKKCFVHASSIHSGVFVVVSHLKIQ